MGQSNSHPPQSTRSRPPNQQIAHRWRGRGGNQPARATEACVSAAPQVSYFASSTDTTANDNRFTTVVVNINEADVQTNSSSIEHEEQAPLVHDLRAANQQQPSLSLSPPAVRKPSNQIYVEHLLGECRGYPLWIPQANTQLPKAYRARGVSIGDVGIFTPLGAFDFLFNICVPADDPINPGKDVVPDGFEPIKLPFNGRYLIREYTEELDKRSYLASSSISALGTDTSGLTFESAASEGAVLTMPEGCHSQELRHIAKFREYMATHAESWYKFANIDLGLEARNGDLRLIIGCDKATSWGMAVFSDFSRTSNLRLQFRALDQSARLSTDSAYIWEHSGRAQVRVGPSKRESEILGATEDQPLCNQSLFLRTLNADLSEEQWAKINLPCGHVLPNQVQEGSSTTHPSSMFIGNPQANSSAATSAAEQSNKGSGTTLCGEADLREIYRKTDLDHKVHFHPSSIINRVLLRKIPSAKIAITSDLDWYSNLPTDWMSTDPEEVFTKVCSSKIPWEENGIASLRPKRHTAALLVQEQREVQDIISRFSTECTVARIETYLFGSQENRSDLLEDLISEFSQSTLALDSTQSCQIPFLRGHPERLLTLDDISETKLSGMDACDILGVTVDALLDGTSSRSDGIEPAFAFAKLGHHFMKQFWRFSEIRDLDEAISCYQECLQVFPKNDHHYLEVLLGLCSAFYHRLKLLGRKKDLQQLLTHLRMQHTFDIKAVSWPIMFQVGSIQGLAQIKGSDTLQEPEIVRKIEESQSDLSKREDYRNRPMMVVQQMQDTNDGNGPSTGLNNGPWIPNQSFGLQRPRPPMEQVPNRPHLPGNLMQSSPSLQHAQSQGNHLLNQGLVPSPTISNPLPQSIHQHPDLFTNDTGVSGGSSANNDMQRQHPPVGLIRANVPLSTVPIISRKAPGIIHRKLRAKSSKAGEVVRKDSGGSGLGNEIDAMEKELERRRKEQADIHNQVLEVGRQRYHDEIERQKRLERLPAPHPVEGSSRRPARFNIGSNSDEGGDLGFKSAGSLTIENEREGAPALAPTLVPVASKQPNNSSATVALPFANVDTDEAAKVRESLAYPLLHSTGRKVVLTTESEFEADFDDYPPWWSEWDQEEQLPSSSFEDLAKAKPGIVSLFPQPPKSIAQEKLKALAERRGVRPNRTSTTPVSPNQPTGYDYDDVPESQYQQQRVHTQSQGQNRQSLVGLQLTQAIPQHAPDPTPIPLYYPYNLPPAAPMTPWTTRRQIRASELSESLQNDLLWERQVSKANMAARKHTASGGGSRYNELGSLQPLTHASSMVQLHAKDTVQQQPQHQQSHREGKNSGGPSEIEERTKRANRSWADDYHYSACNRK